MSAYGRWHRRVSLDANVQGANNAALAKLSCVDMGYYDDPHLHPMPIDAMGRDARGGKRDHISGGRGCGKFGMGGTNNNDDYEPRRRNPQLLNSRLRNVAIIMMMLMCTILPS